MKTNEPKELRIDINTTTVAQVRAMLDENTKSGGSICPCCDQLSSSYRRNITCTMARSLIRLCEEFGLPDSEYITADGWCHVPTLFDEKSRMSKYGGDWAKLRFWGLLEAKKDTLRDDGSNRIGYYRVTQLGKEFAKGAVEVRKYIWIYNDTFLGYDDSKAIVTIYDCLKEKYNYDETRHGDQDELNGELLSMVGGEDIPELGEHPFRR